MKCGSSLHTWIFFCLPEDTFRWLNQLRVKQCLGCNISVRLLISILDLPDTSIYPFWLITRRMDGWVSCRATNRFLLKIQRLQMRTAMRNKPFEKPILEQGTVHSGASLGMIVNRFHLCSNFWSSVDWRISGWASMLGWWFHWPWHNNRIGCVASLWV